MDSEKCLHRLRRGTIEYAALVCLLSASSGAWSQDVAGGATATGGVDALESFIDEVGTLTADFEQQIWTSDRQLFESAAGTMSLKRPNRFFWHYQTPIETIVVADGEGLWMYDVELAQVSVTALADIAAASPAMLLSGDADLRDGFDVVQTYRLDGSDWIKLAPKAAGADFSSVLIGFNGGLPRHLEFVDGLDQTTRIDFSNVVVNAEIADDVFEFEPPAGADVIGTLE
jgi:outer membrane lipoprotein carrier protein